jgi:hypothetical protein
MSGLVCSAIVAFLCVQAPIGGGGLSIKLSSMHRFDQAAPARERL